MRKPSDGDLYKKIFVFGREFEIRYGYYEDFERESAFGEPTPIYPCFSIDPEYTDEGYPFVTQMQSLCEHGDSRFPDGCCVDCSHFCHGEDLIGVCKCKKRNININPKGELKE